jgi:hypothetical protein
MLQAVQKVALRAQLAACRERAEAAERLALRRGDLLKDTLAGLRLARAGLLVALPHLADPRARLVVGAALERSQLPGAR